MNLQRIAKILETKNDLIINDVILNKVIKESQIIHGARAYNYQSPPYLKKKTYDYDILTKKPKKSAQEVAKNLSRRLGKEVKVIRGKHKGTYRLKLNNEVIADYTQMKSKIDTKKVIGIKSRSLKSIKRNIKKLVKNPKKEFRRQKDLDTLERIQEIERIESKFKI